MDRLIVIIEPLLRLFLLGSLIAVVFLFLIRPLLNYLLINKEIEQKKRLLAEMQEMNAVEDGPADFDEDTVSTSPSTTQPSADNPVGSDKKTLAKLAEGNPEKASDLVRNWVNSE